MRKIERYLDLAVPYKLPRWSFTILIFISFYIKAFFVHGYYAIAYLLTFQILQKGIPFLTPKGIPSIIEEEADDNVELPSYFGKLGYKNRWKR